MNDKKNPVSQPAKVLSFPTRMFPHGKTLRIGLHDVTIFERVIEQGYQAGVQAFWDEWDTQEDVRLPDDLELKKMLDKQCPLDLSPDDERIWRAHFILGYMCGHLGLLPVKK